ncbi:MAG: glycosyl hydrolase 53 family protein [Polyangiaceae bacterium]
MRNALSLTAGALLLALACSTGSAGDDAAQGGSVGSGGTASQAGGSTSVSGGAASATGGNSANPSGGTGTGGVNPSGGTGSGGVNPGGAASNGGTSTAGGAASKGGAASNGGTSTAGGAAGSSTLGGTSAGGSSSGGRAASGGSVSSSGGSASGGAATGGASTAGSANSGPVFMPGFIIGADISRAQQQEDGGMRFRDVDGSEPSGTTSTGGGLLTVLKKHKFNYVRLRTFVNPSASGGYAAGLSQAYCDRDHTVRFGAGAKLAGMGVLLNLHYSDNFADPGKQTKPAAWASLSFADLTTRVHDYTKDVVQAMTAGNARPDIVQIGNEIPQGLLFDASGATGGTGGKVSGQAFANLAALLKAGINGVKEVDPNIKIMMHLDRCHDLAVNQWWVAGVQGAGVSFDILGESCYDFTGYQQPSSSWPNTFATLASAYPNLTFTATEYQPQRLLVNQTIAGITGKRGLGSFIFEPTSYNDMNAMLFTISNNVATATTAINDFDTIAAMYLNR